MSIDWLIDFKMLLVKVLLFACLSSANFVSALETETVAKGTNAVLTFGFSAEKIDISDIQKLKCRVTLNSITRLLGNWTTGTPTPIMRLAPALDDIFDHRLTVSYRNGVVSMSLSNTSFADSGIYSCSSPKGQETEVDLRITGGPIFISKNFTESISVEESSTKTFELVFCGNPKPNVKWTIHENSTNVNGELIDNTFRLKSEYISKKYKLKTHCYKYVFETPKIYRDPCNLTATYTAEGDHSNPITGRVTFSVSYQPEPLTDVSTKKVGNDCFHTKWTGPLLNPDGCNHMIMYSVEVVRKSQPSVTFKSYSSNYLFCSKHVGDIDDVTDIRVRYTNKFGKGIYVSTTFGSLPSPAKTTVVPQPPVSVDTKEKDGGFKSIAIATSGLLGLFFLVFIIFIVYYVMSNCRCNCFSRQNIEEGADVGKRDEAKAKSLDKDKNKPIGSLSNKFARKKKIQKENIVHKPRTLAQVTGNPLVKSKTFSGYDALSHRYGGEENLQKGYMPLNTLQRRISESLQTINSLPPPKKVSSMPIFDEIFENANVEMAEDERKRASGASAETECTSLSSRATADNIRGSHLSLGRTYSLESAISDYDMPYTIDLGRSRRKSIYDFPRTPIAEHKQHESSATSPDETTTNTQGYKSEYARPSDVIRRKSSIDEEELRRKRMSAYSSPRKSVMIPEEDMTDGPNSKKDDKVIYDRPRITSTPSIGFEAPVISQVTGLYDTPRIRPKEDDHNNEASMEDKDSQRLSSTLGGSSENLYDNINFILTKYGCASTDSTEQTNVGDNNTDT